MQCVYQILHVAELTTHARTSQTDYTGKKAVTAPSAELSEAIRSQLLELCDAGLVCGYGDLSYHA